MAVLGGQRAVSQRANAVIVRKPHETGPVNPDERVGPGTAAGGRASRYHNHPVWGRGVRAIVPCGPVARSAGTASPTARPFGSQRSWCAWKSQAAPRTRSTTTPERACLAQGFHWRNVAPRKCAALGALSAHDPAGAMACCNDLRSGERQTFPLPGRRRSPEMRRCRRARVSAPWRIIAGDPPDAHLVPVREHTPLAVPVRPALRS